MSKCRFSSSNLELVIDLGLQPLGNGFLPTPLPSEEYFFPLQCGFSEESKLLQLITQPEPNLMFHENYAFFSSTSQRMKTHFENFAKDTISNYSLSSENDFVVEIGCNDGILLTHFEKNGFRHLGVEPSGEVSRIAEEKGLKVINSFFNREVAKQVVEEEGKAKLILAANVFCHIPDITGLVQAIDELLTEEGLVIFEDPYLGDIVARNSYDQIYDEHVFFFSALSVESIFSSVGIELIDCKKIPVHGGSMRYTLARTGKFNVNDSVAQLKQEEYIQKLDKTETYHQLFSRIVESRISLEKQLNLLKDKGLRVSAFGATSKSTTIYNFAQISKDLISVIYDNSPLKIGKFSPGVHIPIVSDSEFRRDDCDVAFLAAWNHRDEILKAKADFASRGGKWLTHTPVVHFIE